jgi:hypothetical protein
MRCLLTSSAARAQHGPARATTQPAGSVAWTSRKRMAAPAMVPSSSYAAPGSDGTRAPARGESSGPYPPVALSPPVTAPGDASSGSPRSRPVGGAAVAAAAAAAAWAVDDATRRPRTVRSVSHSDRPTTRSTHAPLTGDTVTASSSIVHPKNARTPRRCGVVCGGGEGLSQSWVGTLM